MTSTRQRRPLGVWTQTTDLHAAAAMAAAGATVIGGGAALASVCFPHTLGPEILDLAPLGLTRFHPPFLGAMVTLDRLATDPMIAADWPAVAEAARITANPNVRRLATIGGTVAARVATADLPTALCAHATSVHLHDGQHTWSMAVDDYLAEPAVVGLITGIELGPGAMGAYRRIAGRPGPAPAIAAVAGVQTPDGVRFWAGAVANRPIPFAGNQPPVRSSLRDDDRASAAYRHRLLAVLADDVRDAIESRRPMKLTVDGTVHELDAEPHRILASFLRDDLGVASVKIGCSEGACGACVALVDGVALPTCLLYLGRLDGAEVLTAAGASATPVGARLVDAIVEEGGLQCGFCTPGVLCTVLGLTSQVGAWSESDVREALAGHLCRCTGYTPLIRAVRQVLLEVAA